MQTFSPLGKKDALTILRVDPNLYKFVLCTALEENSSSKDLTAWLTEKNLLAVINASMYLKDGKTSTGYMKQGRAINNPRIQKKFGAFFVADPDTDSLPQATILERDTEHLERKLEHYNLIIQNYRLINSERRILWPKRGDQHAIAAIGTDGGGHILFIFHRYPILPHTLAEILLALPLDIRTTMYVEGGSEAGLLFLENNKLNKITSLPFFEPVLPNVVGIQKKVFRER